MEPIKKGVGEEEEMLGRWAGVVMGRRREESQGVQEAVLGGQEEGMGEDGQEARR